jgi:site-specific DNA recombinase
VRYRYYVSQPYLRGITKPPIGAIVRVPATDLEAAVTKAVEQHLIQQNKTRAGNGSAEQKIIFPSISRIEVRKDKLAVWLRPADEEGRDVGTHQPAVIEGSPALLIPWTKPPTKRFREILLPASTARRQVRPIKFERRAALLKSIARGRAWLDAIISGVETVEEIAARHKCSVRHVNMTISMAFIAPGLVKAAVEGRLPRGISVASLRDAPAEWSLQYERLGLTSA